MFPSAGEAKAHYAAKHPRRATPPGPRRARKTQTGAILEALRGGSHTAADVSRKTKIPLTRVHSLLSYLRRRGQVKGFKDKLKAVG